MKSICILIILSLSLLALSSTSFAAEPGVPARTLNEARRPVVSDQKAGSVLVYNIYTSGATDSAMTDTAILITNTETARSATVHLFFIAQDCSIADSYICLTQNQTASFMASDVDPGVTGYMVAIATDLRGLPLSFNFLIGSELVKFASGHAAHLNAESYSAFFNGTLPGTPANAVMGTILFNGSQYDAAPRTLAGEVRSFVDGNSAMLILNSLQINLATGGSPISEFIGTVYDDAENAIGFRQAAACQFRGTFSDEFPRSIIPKYSQFIPKGRTGWVRLMARDDLPMSGALINFNPDAATKRSAFNGGRNLHHLRFTEGRMMMPIFSPSC